ncbi:UDP-N-acetylmuramate--L-alanine ligase [Stomatohabitans albus]|uniref:UDP-N-acetylmuramate--L-alanine ligase n=1 Tax=Stomatohabitans albus TaxID=3110766 RepID=UPI00300D76F9
MNPVTTNDDGLSPGEGFTDPATLSLGPDTRIHLIGIGGSGMNGLAQLLIERHIPVSGSDLRGGMVCDVLTSMGATVHVGHAAKYVEGADIVVVSNAVPRTNVERQWAHDHGIPVILRADLLNLLMRGNRRILISGTHGKTTTTAMTTRILQAGGLDPSFAIGGALHAGGNSAHHGSSDVFVAEADEAFRSFIRLRGDCIVVTNIEMDHHDVFSDEAALHTAFKRFIEVSNPDGPLLICADDPGSATFGQMLRKETAYTIATYGTTDGVDVQITDISHTETGGSSFTITDHTGLLPEPISVTVAVPGRHNVLNATAALMAATWAGADWKTGAEGLTAFTGAARRFQYLGSAKGIRVVDDYGHHPTELEATVQAAKQANPDGRVVALFQPHRYSRTQAMGKALGVALADADLVIVTDIYAAGEAAVPGVTGALVADGVKEAGGNVRFLPDRSTLLDVVAGVVQPGDLLLTVGAGDVTEFGPQLLDHLDGR